MIYMSETENLHGEVNELEVGRFLLSKYMLEIYSQALTHKNDGANNDYEMKIYGKLKRIWVDRNFTLLSDLKKLILADSELKSSCQRFLDKLEACKRKIETKKNGASYSNILSGEIEEFKRENCDIEAKLMLAQNSNDEIANSWMSEISYSSRRDKTRIVHKGRVIIDVTKLKSEQLNEIKALSEFEYVNNFFGRHFENGLQYVNRDWDMLNVIAKLAEAGIEIQNLETVESDQAKKFDNMYIPHRPCVSDNLEELKAKAEYVQNRIALFRGNMDFTRAYKSERNRILVGNELAVQFIRSSSKNLVWLESDLYKTLSERHPKLYFNLAPFFLNFSCGFKMMLQYKRKENSKKNELMEKIISCLEKFNYDLEKSVNFFYVLLSVLEKAKGDNKTISIESITLFLDTPFLDLLAIQIENVKSKNDDTLNWLLSDEIINGLAVDIRENKFQGEFKKQQDKLKEALDSKCVISKAIVAKVYFYRYTYPSLYEFLFSFEDSELPKALNFLDQLSDRNYLISFMEFYEPRKDDKKLKDSLKDSILSNKSLEEIFTQLLTDSPDVFFAPQAQFENLKEVEIKHLMKYAGDVKEIFAKASIAIGKINSEILSDNDKAVIQRRLASIYAQLHYDIYIDGGKLQSDLEKYIDQSGFVNLEELLPSTLTNKADIILEIKRNGYYMLDGNVTANDKIAVAMCDTNDIADYMYLIYSGANAEQRNKVVDLKHSVDAIKANLGKNGQDLDGVLQKVNRLIKGTNKLQKEIIESNKNAATFYTNENISRAKMLTDPESIFDKLDDESKKVLHIFLSVYLSQKQISPGTKASDFFSENPNLFFLIDTDIGFKNDYNKARKPFDDNLDFYSRLENVLKNVSEWATTFSELAEYIQLQCHCLMLILDKNSDKDPSKQYVLSMLLDCANRLSRHDPVDWKMIDELKKKVEAVALCNQNIVQAFDKIFDDGKSDEIRNNKTSLDNAMADIYKMNMFKNSGVTKDDELINRVDEKINLYNVFESSMDKLGQMISKKVSPNEFQDQILKLLGDICASMVNVMDMKEKFVYFVFCKVADYVSQCVRKKNYNFNLEARFSKEFEQINKAQESLMNLRKQIADANGSVGEDLKRNCIKEIVASKPDEKIQSDWRQGIGNQSIRFIDMLNSDQQKLSAIKNRNETLKDFINDLDLVNANEGDIKYLDALLQNELFGKKANETVCRLRDNLAARILSTQGKDFCVEHSKDKKAAVIDGSKEMLDDSIVDCLKTNSDSFTLGELANIKVVLVAVIENNKSKRKGLFHKNKPEDITESVLTDLKNVIELKTRQQYSDLNTAQLLEDKYLNSKRTVLKDYETFKRNNKKCQDYVLGFTLMDTDKKLYGLLENEIDIYAELIEFHLSSSKIISDRRSERLIRTIFSGCKEIKNENDKKATIKKYTELVKMHEGELSKFDERKFKKFCEQLYREIKDADFNRDDKSNVNANAENKVSSIWPQFINFKNESSNKILSSVAQNHEAVKNEQQL